MRTIDTFMRVGPDGLDVRAAAKEGTTLLGRLEPGTLVKATAVAKQPWVRIDLVGFANEDGLQSPSDDCLGVTPFTEAQVRRIAALAIAIYLGKDADIHMSPEELLLNDEFGSDAVESVVEQIGEFTLEDLRGMGIVADQMIGGVRLKYALLDY